MDVWLYCSYVHSRTGFFLTRVAEDGLVPVPSGSLPSEVDSFFTYDCFSLLWRDLSVRAGGVLQRRDCTGSFFGLRNLRGQMGGERDGTVNLAFLASEQELTALKRLALCVLGNLPAFQARLFSWMGVGGPCSYTLDVPAFRAWMEDCARRGRLRSQTKDSPALRLLGLNHREKTRWLERDFLHLAVCTGPWETARSALGGDLSLHHRPTRAIGESDFEEIFLRPAPLWSMESRPGRDSSAARKSAPKEDSVPAPEKGSHPDAPPKPEPEHPAEPESEPAPELEPAPGTEQDTAPGAVPETKPDLPPEDAGPDTAPDPSPAP